MQPYRWGAFVLECFLVGNIHFGRTHSYWEDAFILGGRIHIGRTHSHWEDAFILGGRIHIGRTHSYWEDAFILGGRIHIGRAQFYWLLEGSQNPKAAERRCLVAKVKAA